MKRESLVRFQRRFFTLVEIIVTLIVVSIVSAIFTVNLRDLWRQQAFMDESNLLLNQLRLAQDMMQIMNEDIEVGFKADGQKHLSRIYARGNPQKFAISIADRSTLEFANIGPLFFEDINGLVLDKDFFLTFYSHGFAMNHGSLQFGPLGAKEPTNVIVLRGYPEPLVVQPISSYNPQPSTQEQSQIERLTEATRQETEPEQPKEEEKKETKEPPKDEKA